MWFKSSPVLPSHHKTRLLIESSLYGSAKVIKACSLGGARQIYYLRGPKQLHNSPFKTPKVIDFGGYLRIHGNMFSLPFRLSAFSFSNSKNSFSLTSAHDCWPRQGDFTLAWLLVFVGLVPRVHQMLIDAERPLNLPMGDSPLVNYFIMVWQSCCAVELRGVLLPAHHTYPDNLVNKGHR